MDARRRRKESMRRTGGGSPEVDPFEEGEHESLKLN